MSERAIPTADVGVIVGRFQVPSLHDGHKSLIDFVLSRHKKVLILIGKTPGVLVTRENPLDYHTRMLMIKEQYPFVSVLPLNDMPSDEDWSKSVDKQIDAAFDGAEKVLLYGSRDSFIPSYSGKWPTVELEQACHLSGTAIRKSVSDEVRNTEEFRRGVIYAAFNRHPVAYSTIDAAIIDFDNNRIFLGKKEVDGGKLRLPGGFVDSRRDSCLEDAVRREVMEEMGSLELDPNIIWLGSHKVDDWRYRNGADCIITNLFIVRYLFGSPKAGDDLSDTAILPINDNLLNVVVEYHRPLIKKVLAYLKKESNR